MWRRQGSGSASRWRHLLALALVISVGAGESAVLHHLATADHVPCLMNGRIVFFGDVSHPEPRPADTASITPQSGVRTPLGEHATATTRHHHALQLAAEKYDKPAPIDLMAPEPACDRRVDWSATVIVAAACCYRLAPKQSPPA